MHFNKKKILNILFLLLIYSILIFPKINIISIPGSRTGIRLDDIFVLIYFIYFVYFVYKYMFCHKKTNPKLKKIFVAFSICFTIFFISTLLGVVRGNISLVISFLHLIRNVEYFILLFAGYDYIENSQNKNSIFIVLNSILIFHGIYMILEYFNIIGDIGFLIGRPGNDRIYTTFSGPYEFSAFLTILLPLYLYNIFKEKKWMNLFFVLIIFIGVFISQSRISLLACLIITILMYLFVYKSSKKKTISLVSIILLIIFAVTAANTKLFERFKNIDITSSLNTFQLAWENTDYEYYRQTGSINYSEKVLSSTTDLSYAFRVSKWATLLKEMIKTPLFGLGLSIAGEAIDGNYVRLLVESGILGLASWLALLWIIFKEALKYRKNKLSYLVIYGVISLSIIAVFIDIFVSSKVIMLFWFLVGAMYAYSEKEKKSNKKKIIHFVSGVNFGGVESVILNYFSNMKNKNKYDNIIVSHEKINLDNRKLFEDLGFKFYEVTPKRISIVKNFLQINKIIKEEQPDIVHTHMTLSSYMSLFIADINGVRVRICHSHLALNDISFKEKIEKYLCNYYANAYVACSVDASKYLFTKSNQKKCYILNNAIDLNKFDLDEKVRNNVRNELNISDSFVVGNIGRFTEQKNHKKIINIFEEIVKIKENSILILIGDGALKEDIKKIVSEKGLDNKVIFLSGTNQVEKYYQAMDVFLFPSLFEGLGIVVVEAQVSGLPCIVSNKVPHAVKVTDLVEFIDLNTDDNKWANITMKYSSNTRKSQLKRLRNTNFDIRHESNKLDKIYTKLLKGE